MVIKCQKMVQMSWNLDKVCISGRCIEFQKKFENFLKIGPFLAEKRQFFTFFAFRFRYRFFYGKRNNSIKNALIDLLFGIQPPYSACNKSAYGILEILNFHWVMTHFVGQRGKFWSILVIFYKKMSS